MRPVDMPPAERFKHGTRSRYVSGCRCAPCRASNAAYYHERQRVCRELAAQVTDQIGPVVAKWTPPGGSERTRTFARVCPGAHGEPCPNMSHLRKDSKGGVCSYCRQKLGWDGLVDAAPALAHMRELSDQGIGRRAVHDACGVALALIEDIRSGAKTKIRRSTAARILSVDAGARADASLMPAGPTWVLLNQLIARGWRRRDLARELGRKGVTPVLQIRRDFCLASTALAVEKMFKRLGDPPEHGTRWKPRFCDCLSPRLRGERCEECGALARPRGMTQALVAGGPEHTKPVHRAFGYEGGWGFEQRQSKVGKKRESKELRKLARAGGAKSQERAA